MHVNLREINIKSFLEFLLKEQRFGILSVEIPTETSSKSHHNLINHQSVKKISQLIFSDRPTSVKNLFLVSGEITEAFDSQQTNFQRLEDCLAYYQLEDKLSKYLSAFTSEELTDKNESDCLIWLLQHEYLKPLQMKTIILRIIEETLFEIFSSPRGKITFHVDSDLHPICHGRSTIKTIHKIDRQLKQWRQLSPDILSPHQSLSLENRQYLNDTLSSKTYDCLVNWTDTQQSLLQISRRLNCSWLDLAKALYPYLQQGLLTLKTNPSNKITSNLGT